MNIDTKPKRLNDTIFREYDIRGVVGSQLPIAQIYDLACAIAALFKQRNSQIRTVAVGMDGRTHSPAIKQELCRALCDSGLDVLFLGVVPSPVLYFALHTQPVDAGLMITASHNPKEYNGIKICLGTTSLWGSDIQEIKRLYHAQARCQTDQEGSVREYDIIPTYIESLKEQFPHLIGCTVPCVLDCGNGATAAVVPALVRAMNWQHVQQLCCTIDGTYPNHPADPTVAENVQDLCEMLAKTEAEVGFGFDGDGDRLGVVTKSGELVSGDKLLALFAQFIQKESDQPLRVVFDVKASSGLIELLERWGITPVMSASGHSIVKNEMEKHGAQLGGELSCHLFFKDRNFGYDDAMYAALRLLELIIRSGKTIEQLLEVFPRKHSSTEYRIPYAETDRERIIKTVREQLQSRPGVSLVTIDGVRATMRDGWYLLRPSNTQAVLSVRCESDTAQGLERLKADVIALLGPFVESEHLNPLRASSSAG